MRIALVHMRHRRRGGTERFLNELARRLAECGHDVVILCRSHEAAPDPRVSFQRLEPFSIGASWRMWAFARAVEFVVAPRRAVHEATREGGCAGVAERVVAEVQDAHARFGPHAERGGEGFARGGTERVAIQEETRQLGARKSARAIASAPLSSTAQSPRSSVRSAGAAARAAARARTESRARA